MTAEPLTVRASELLLGGQKSGKSRRAEDLAAAWLRADARHRAVMLPTAQAHDEEMRQRIARHQRERAMRVPGMRTLELAPSGASALPAAVAQAGGTETLRVIDCMGMWLTQQLMPLHGAPASAADCDAACDSLLAAVRASAGPVVLVSNELGLGVMPLGREVRAFVDALGTLNQRLAAACDRVTLMAAGLPLTLKDSAGQPQR